MTSVIYFDELKAGQRFFSTQRAIDAPAIKRFAAEYDPQPFHLDEGAAKESFFHGLAASGWHTAAITMRLFVDSDFKPAGGIIGAGIQELQWACPVRPRDSLRVEVEVLETRPSKSKPDHGV